MTQPIYVDAVSLINTYKGGGIAGLDVLASWADSMDRPLIVTDVVRSELVQKLTGTVDPALLSWVDGNTTVVQTAEMARYSEYLASGTPADYVLKDKGERSIVELMNQLPEQDRSKAVILSEDVYFRRSPVYWSNQWGPSQVITQAAATGLIDAAEYGRIRDGFQAINTYNPTKVGGEGYSKSLDKFIEPSELVKLQSVGASGVSVRTLQIIGRSAGILGGAAMIFDIGTSTAEAAQQLQNGNQGDASRIMLQLAARLYASTQGALSGASVGARTGGLIFGLPGALAGAIVGAIGGGMGLGAAADYSVDALWSVANRLISILTNNDYIKQPELQDPWIPPYISDEWQYRADLASAGVPSDLVDRLIDSIQKSDDPADIAALKARVDAIKALPATDAQSIKITNYQLSDWEAVTIVESSSEIVKVHSDRIEVTKFSEENQADPTWVYQEKRAWMQFVKPDGTLMVGEDISLRDGMPKEVYYEYQRAAPVDLTPQQFAELQDSLAESKARLAAWREAKKNEPPPPTLAEMLAKLQAEYDAIALASGMKPGVPDPQTAPPPITSDGAGRTVVGYIYLGYGQPILWSTSSPGIPDYITQLPSITVYSDQSQDSIIGVMQDVIDRWSWPDIDSILRDLYGYQGGGRNNLRTAVASDMPFGSSLLATADIGANSEHATSMEMSADGKLSSTEPNLDRGDHLWKVGDDAVSQSPRVSVNELNVSEDMFAQHLIEDLASTAHEPGSASMNFLSEGSERALANMSSGSQGDSYAGTGRMDFDLAPSSSAMPYSDAVSTSSDVTTLGKVLLAPAELLKPTGPGPTSL